MKENYEKKNAIVRVCIYLLKKSIDTDDIRQILDLKLTAEKRQRKVQWIPFQ
jgi:hypothetical protein